MELLIPGLALVALMVYVSTRIKKSAARAFERERFESDDFELIKPEGFLQPVRDESTLAFEAYSKEFAKEPADAFRQATMAVTSYPGGDIDALARKAADDGELISEDRGRLAAETMLTMHTKSDIGGAAYDKYYKFISRNGVVYELVIQVVSGHTSEYLGRIEDAIGSFSVK